MPERLTKCPLCKSGHFLNQIEITDYAVTKESFLLSKCTECDLLFTNPRPTSEEIAPYYDFLEYYSHQDNSRNLTHWIYQRVRNYSTSKKIELIEQYEEEGKLLDYGCGTGELLNEARINLWKVTGIEPNDKARNQAIKKLGNRVYPSIDELKKENVFDVITLFHVLEHIHDLRKTLKKLLSHLKSDGYLIIAVPNHESFDGKIYGKFWAGWDVPRHLYHFNTKAITRFKEEFELSLVEIKPMIFDSFYVSLLSEKYQNPNQSQIRQYSRAIKNGLKSNQQAKNPGDYSSNIFIFQKK
ncbi:MAG: class I SAM-dependent methyltransferase [Algoriphagus sp.]|nr:class I SAM-dependent methyltransferase [Algoriphagus sp.]